MSGYHFAVRQVGREFHWVLLDTIHDEMVHRTGQTIPSVEKVLASSPSNFATKEEAYAAIGAVRAAVRLADITVLVDESNLPGVTPPKTAAAPEPRWRKIDAQGNVGELSQDPPDNEPDEGETGPPEVQG